MTRLFVLCVAAAAGVLLLIRPVMAQPPPAAGEWTRSSSINIFGGLAADGTHSGVNAGAAVGWDVTPRIGMEATASWLDRGARADAFAADLSMLFDLTTHRRVVPFVKAGGGVYRMWLDTVESPLPDFYAQRIVPRPIGTSATFTDGMVVAAGGLNAWITTRLALRPEVEARFIFGGGDTHVVPAVGLRLAFYFEEHPVTDRRPRATASR
jgi:hypothetical protein